MTHDIAIVGGGLAGTSLATCMARAGARVLVLERTEQFRDRVRGEGMHPWGVPEFHALNLYDKLLKTCAHQPRYWTSYRGSSLARKRDLIETTAQRTGAVDFYHPEMQEVLLEEAIEAGAEVRRGVTVTQASGGTSPAITASMSGTDDQRFSARLIVGADGRQSVVRRDGGFEVTRDPGWLRISGALFEGMGAPENSVHVFVAPNFGHTSLLFPIGGGRIRVYFATGRRAEHRALGPADVSDFSNYCAEAGVPREWLDRAQLAGPLATFEAADVWVDHPYKAGLVLVGDAAAANDPCWGCGLSLTLRDVRVLRDALLASDDWDAACRRYAEEHDRYYRALHRITSWLTAVRYTLGPERDRLRKHTLARLADGSGPDLIAQGPDCPSDEDARVRFLGR